MIEVNLAPSEQCREQGDCQQAVRPPGRQATMNLEWQPRRDKSQQIDCGQENEDYRLSASLTNANNAVVTGSFDAPMLSLMLA